MKKFISIYLSVLMLFSVLTAASITTQGAENSTQPTHGTENSTQPIQPTQPINPTQSDQVTSGKCGKTSTWNYDSATKALTISGSGKIFDFSYDSVPWFHFSSSIK